VSEPRKYKKGDKVRINGSEGSHFAGHSGEVEKGQNGNRIVTVRVRFVGIMAFKETEVDPA
jgi:hypothetical protein